MTWIPWLAAVAIVVALLVAAVRVLAEYERGVVFRLGRIVPLKGPGLVLLIPGIDRLVRVSLRIITLDVPRQAVITRDNVSIAVNAVIYFRVVDPIRATLSVQDYFYATSQLSQTTLRSVVGQADLDTLLAERDQVNRDIQEILDRHTDPWGIKVTQVELKDIDLPDQMQRAMARQAEAERERRAKVIAAEGELQASSRITEAAQTLDATPTSLHLRYLQTLVEVAAERNSTILFPVPIDLLGAFSRERPVRYDRPRGGAPGAEAHGGDL